LVSPDPPDGLWLDISGCSHLHGSETQLLMGLCGQFEKRGITARVAVADTAGAAHALARYSGQKISAAPPGDSTGAVTHLPAASLRLDEETAAMLHRLGIATIDQLLALPKASLGRRFGTHVLSRLEQAVGSKPEPIQPITPPQIISARVGFVEPLLTPEAFSLITKQLVTKICAKLARAGSGALQLDLLSRSVDGSVQTIRVVAAQPTRDACHITRLFADKLEQFDFGLGIEEVRVVVTRDVQLTCSQNAAPFSSAAPEEASDTAPPALIDRLTNRLGAARIYRTEPVESNVPERSVRRVTAMSPPSGQTWPENLPRPVRLISPTQTVEAIALLPDRPPVVFTWRRKRFRIRHADGPERIQGEWWHRDAEMTAVRDYWCVEDESGRRFWLYRRGDGQDRETGDLRWFLHGIF
jgi:protein ImuB